jgi:exo-rhamnogalacturonan lyase-like protein
MLRIIACVSVLISAAASPARALEVPLTVTEPVGVARKAEPVSSGVCFKAGEVKDVAKLTLVDANGKAVPCQFTPLVTLKDGSHQWVLADFQADVPANGKATYTVKTGERAAPAQPVKTSEKDGVYTLATGSLELTVDASSAVFELIKSAKVGGVVIVDGAGIEAMTCRDALNGNKLYHAGKPTQVGWDYNGPMRATLMLEGPYVDAAGVEWLGYRVRVTVYAGRKLVRIEHSLRNSCATQARNVKVKDAFLRLGLEHNAEISTTKDFMTTGVGGVFVKHRLLSGYFSPTLHELGVRGKLLTMAVVPLYEGGFDSRNHRGYNKHEKGSNFGQDDTGSWWLIDSAYKIDEYWLNFDTTTPAAGGLRSTSGGDANLAKALDSRLYALASSGYYAECDALSFGRFGSLDDEAATYKAWGWKNIEARKAALLKGRWMSPQPGYHVASVSTHGDSETDDAEGMLLMALRTGGRGYFDAGLAWARLYTNHFVRRIDFPRGKRRGRGPAMTYKGNDYNRIVRYGPSYGNTRSCGCHFYGAGAMDYYLLTGEKSLLLGCEDLAHYATDRWMKHKPGRNGVAGWGSRAFGRQFMAAVRYFEITRDPKWKKRMAHMAKLVLNDPSMIRQGDWLALHSGGSNGVEKKHVTKRVKSMKRLQEFMKKNGITWDERTSTASDAKGNKWAVYDMAGSWEQTYVQQGVHRYWRLTGDKKAADYVVGFANFFKKYTWNPKCQQAGYRLWGVNFPTKDYCLGSHDTMFSPGHDKCPGPGAKHSGWYTRFGPDVAVRAFEVSGDKKYLEHAKMYWNRGSKRGYQRTKQSAPDDAVGNFASHTPPKDDSILSTALMFYTVPRVK